jgi:hypothetical protein
MNAVRSTERWDTHEIVGQQVAVRDDQLVLVCFVHAQDAELVAGAPAMLDALRAMLEVVERDAPGVVSTPAFAEARALVDDLGRERDLCPDCEGSSCDAGGNACRTCDGMGIVVVGEGRHE